MKILIISLALLTSSVAFSGVGDPNETVTGKVKEFKVQVYHATSDTITGTVIQGNPKSQFTANVHYEFDEQYRLKTRIYYSKGKPYLTYTSIYGKTGQLDSAFSYVRDESASPDRTIYSYTNGLLIASRSFEDDGRERDTYEYTYDEKGQVLTMTYFFWTKPNSREEYVYDENGNVIKMTTVFLSLDPSGRTMNRTEYVYDTNGNLVNEKKYESSGELAFETEYGYDSAGRKTRTCNKSEDGHCHGLYEDKYDDHGNVTWSSSYWENPDETVVSNIHEMQYEYDEQGNWIKKTVFLNGLADEIVTREIKY